MEACRAVLEWWHYTHDPPKLLKEALSKQSSVGSVTNQVPIPFSHGRSLKPSFIYKGRGGGDLGVLSRRRWTKSELVHFEAYLGYTLDISLNLYRLGCIAVVGGQGGGWCTYNTHWVPACHLHPPLLSKLPLQNSVWMHSMYHARFVPLIIVKWHKFVFATFRSLSVTYIWSFILLRIVLNL